MSEGLNSPSKIQNTQNECDEVIVMGWMGWVGPLNAHLLRAPSVLITKDTIYASHQGFLYRESKDQ